MRHVPNALCSCLALAMGLGFAGSSAWAQQGPATLAGTVFDGETRAPLAGVRVTLLGTSQVLLADTGGRFTQRGLSPGPYLLQFRAIGYALTTVVVDLAPGEVRTQDFEMRPIVHTLDPITVENERVSLWRVGFEARRKRGRGVFLTETDIRAASATRLSDVLRSVPGVRMTCNSRGCGVRMARAARECSPDYYMDGTPANFSTHGNMSPQGIIGIEIYRTLTETPLEFLRTSNTCGTIVIWTRSGP